MTIDNSLGNLMITRRAQPLSLTRYRHSYPYLTHFLSPHTLTDMHAFYAKFSLFISSPFPLFLPSFLHLLSSHYIPSPPSLPLVPSLSVTTLLLSHVGPYPCPHPPGPHRRQGQGPHRDLLDLPPALLRPTASISRPPAVLRRPASTRPAQACRGGPLSGLLVGRLRRLRRRRPWRRRRRPAVGGCSDSAWRSEAGQRRRRQWRQQWQQELKAHLSKVIWLGTTAQYWGPVLG